MDFHTFFISTLPSDKRKNKALINKRDRRYYAEYKAKGLCIKFCGRKSTETSVMCEECLAKKRQFTKTFYYNNTEAERKRSRKKQIRYIKEGRCKCGRDIGYLGRKQCPICNEWYLWANTWR